MKFTNLVDQIRSDLQLNIEVPGFDSKNGNEAAKFLFLLEAPGPKAIKTGVISFDNPDPSARNFRNQLSEAEIDRSDIAIWNIVPWYLGNETMGKIRSANGCDVRAGLEYLSPIISAMENLRCIILVGGAARRAHLFLSRITTARIISCHHPSARVLNVNPAAAQENIDIFKFIKATT